MSNYAVFNIRKDGAQGTAGRESGKAVGKLLLYPLGIPLFPSILHIAHGDLPVPALKAETYFSPDRPVQDQLEAAHGHRVVIDQIQKIYEQGSYRDKLKENKCTHFTQMSCSAVGLPGLVSVG